MNNNIVELLECLVDELRNSELEPSERTVYVLAEYEKEHAFIQEYFKELDEMRST
jgi:hypothetical protein